MNVKRINELTHKKKQQTNWNDVGGESSHPLRQ